MDPYFEQRLRDEVIYLHSLWHQGPPSTSLPHTNLQPFNSTNFKKKKPPKSNPKQPKKVGNFSGTEWPVKPSSDKPPVTQSGWPELKLNPKTQPTRLPTPQELEKYNWNQVQQKALKTTKEFYSKNEDDDVDDDDNDEDDDDDDDDDNDDDKEYDFFWKLFNDDDELKGYYGKYCGGGGEFLCLVCGGANEKCLKRYKDCIALVQHSISISKTKRKRSHRDYGKVICKVLGWDIDRLPSSIVSDHQSGELQVNDVNADKDVNVASCNEGLNEIMDIENSNGKANDALETVDGDSMVCEGISNVEEENHRKQVLNEAEGNTGGAVSNLCRNMSSTMVLEVAPE